jgi:hypothetical protein
VQEKSSGLKRVPQNEPKERKSWIGRLFEPIDLGACSGKSSSTHPENLLPMCKEKRLPERDGLRPVRAKWIESIATSLHSDNRHCIRMFAISDWRILLRLPLGIFFIGERLTDTWGHFVLYIGKFPIPPVETFFFYAGLAVKMTK